MSADSSPRFRLRHPDEYQGGGGGGGQVDGRERDKERFGYEALINVPDR